MYGLCGDDRYKGEGRESRGEKEDYESVLIAIATVKSNLVLQWISGLSYLRAHQFHPFGLGLLLGHKLAGAPGAG